MRKFITYILGLVIIGLGLGSFCNANSINTSAYIEMNNQQAYSYFLLWTGNNNDIRVDYSCTLDFTEDPGETPYYLDIIDTYGDYTEQFESVNSFTGYFTTTKFVNTIGFNISVEDDWEYLGLDISCVLSGNSLYTGNDRSVFTPTSSCGGGGAGSSCDTGAILSGYITQSSCDSQYSGYILPSSCPSCPTINSEYCINNNLCPSCPTINKAYCESEYGLIDPSECPSSSTGDINWSALFINEIQHLGSDSIYITIPEEIDRDYSRSDSEFDLVINGVNGDQDYINAIIDQQTIHPSSEDFGKSISLLFSGYAPYAIILVFLLVVWGLIRKIFK